MSVSTLLSLTGARALALTLAFALMMTEALHYGVTDAGPLAKAVTLAFACSLFGMLLRHGPVLLWAPMLALAYGLLTVAVHGPGVESAFQLSVGVFAVTLLMASLTALIAQATNDSSVVQLSGLVVLIAATAAPVYASPLAQLHAESTWLVNTIVAVSPLSVLAALVDFDYLRQPWFYQNTAFGGLRFHYPAAAPAISLYLAMAAMALALTLVLARKNNDKRTTAT